jgi:methylated-DNA-[protein]-cysteine S-methyltransferase
MNIWTTTYDSPIGPLKLAATSCGLSGLHFEGARHPVDGSAWTERRDQFAEAMRQLDQYFAGKRRRFELKLDMIGTEFQRRVWQQLTEIPFGTTISYGELARRVGDVKASRAVGLANGRNPVAVIVPCHRVIGANGALTGFGGGLPRKRFLLDLEIADFELVGQAA